VTSLPVWAVVLLAFGSPLLTAVIALRGQQLNRWGTEEHEVESKRQEVMVMLRWAAELAVSDDVAKARLGNQELKALQRSKLLGATEVDFIFAALDASLEGPVQAIEQAGDDVEIVAVTSLGDNDEVFVPSEQESRPEEGALEQDEPAQSRPGSGDPGVDMPGEADG
jgi:hypothetical protein